MKRLLSIGSLAALTAVSASAADPSARDAFAAGLRDFAASNFSAAADGFLEAAAAAPAAKLDPAAALFNAGLAAYADGNFEAAADSFARASAGSNLRLQSQAFYNRGNALFQQVGANSAPLPALPLPNASSQQLAAAAASVGDAIQMFENAIALDPDDVDAKANYELAVLKQNQIQQQQQQQRNQQEQQDQEQEQEQQDPQNQEDRPDQNQNPEQQPQPQEEPRPQPEEPTDENQNQEDQIEDNQPSEQMTPEEAAMLLDAMKAQEQSQRDRLHPFFGRPVPVEKDW